MRLWNRGKTEENGESLRPREGGAPPQARPRRRWKKRTVALLAAAALAVAGGGFGLWQLFFGTASAAVLTGETTYGTLDTTIEGTGTTVPAESVTYTAEANAEVLEVCVSAGDTVEEGDLLYDQDYSTGGTLGAIQSIEVQPSGKLTELYDGTVVSAPAQDSVNLVLTIQGEGLISEGRYQLNRIYDLGINASRNFYTPYAQFTGTVTSIG